jgi:hypothetical protein
VDICPHFIDKCPEGSSVPRIHIPRYSPALWEALHDFVLPLGPIVLMTLFFLRWSSTPGIARSTNSAAHDYAAVTEVIAERYPVEVRLAGRRSLDPAQVSRFFAVIFGTGDFRIRTEDRPSPPPLVPGDRLQLGPLRATVERLQDHPRLALLRFDGSARDIWAGFARHGKPIQYAHVSKPLALWDVWSPIAANPVAFEPPSAGFVLSWETLGSITDKGVQFATLTHSAGLSSTGDAQLDARLPFDEPYRIPVSTAELPGPKSVVRALWQSARRW